MRKRLWVFEGADGSGKTTLAKALAADVGATYIHHGAYKGLGPTYLVANYLHSMSRAILGLNDVVLDRSWISEGPYGRAFRGGEDRVTERAVNLERAAKCCVPLVVMCVPPWEDVLRGYRARRGSEMLETEDQLLAVYTEFRSGPLMTRLNETRIDPLSMSTEEAVRHVIDEMAIEESGYHD